MAAQAGAVERAWQAALDLLTVEAKKALQATGKDREGHEVKKSIGLVGGGLHTSGYQLRRHIPGAYFAWSMEVNELAKRGASALDEMEGEYPERLGRFDSPEYLARKRRCTVEL